MKRWMMAGAALVLALTLGTVGTLAASPWCRGGQRDCLQNGVCDGSYCRYVDADGNGVCDNHNCRYTDSNGDGVCDNCACRYVDANGDGVCDNAGTCGGGQHHGSGGHHGGRC